MTPEDAAHQAADREGLRWETRDPQRFVPTYVSDLYVRAFLAGARWQQQQETPMDKFTYEETKTLARGPSAEVDSATGSPRSPQPDGSPRKDTA